MPTQFKNILEKTSRKYTAVLKDLDGVSIPSATLNTLHLTLYSIHSLAIINSRQAQNVLNANQVTVDANGNLAWEMLPANNAILDDSLATEIHRALFEWTWAGTKSGAHEVDFQVRNLNKVI